VSIQRYLANRRQKTGSGTPHVWWPALELALLIAVFIFVPVGFVWQILLCVPLLIATYWLGRGPFARRPRQTT
jgi:membrane protein implicated in regulation of membrane protease activity